MECSDVADIYTIEGYAFFVISILVFVFGTSRGSPVRQINFYSTNVALCLTSTVFFAAKHNLFCGVLYSSAHPDRDELLLSRFIVYGVFLTALVIMVTIRAAENVIDIISHTVLSILSSSFWLFAAISSGELQYFWIYNSGIYAGILFLHMVLGNRSYTCSDSIYATRLIYLAIVYALTFYVTTLCGPWFADRIDLRTQEWVLLVSDTLIVGFIFVSIVHFGNIRKLEERSTRMVPGDLSKMNPSERRRYHLNEHTIDA